MKPKSKILKDDLLADGTVHFGYDSKGNLWEHGKLVKSVASVKPIEPKAVDVVVRPQPTNIAPSPIERAVQKATPEAFGLQRAILANIAAQGGHVATAPEKTDEVTGLQRAINANIVAQKSKE